MTMRILITGGAGFIGSHLADRLCERGDEVVILDNFSSGKRENLTGPASAARLVEGDIRSIDAHAEAIGKVDAVVHLAALISGYDSLHDPVGYDDVNIRGTLAVIDHAHRHGIPRIVFASSSTVYGAQAETTLSEATPPLPVTVYALSKLAGEHLLRLYGMLHGFSHCSLRLFNVYGPRQAIDHPYANVTCKFSHAAAQGLPVPLFGDGEQSRDFVYVDDVVEAFLAVLPGAPLGVYNVGTGEGASINQLIATLGEIAGKPLTLEPRDAWPNDVRAVRADASLIERDLGVRARVSLHDGLARTVDFHR